MTLKFRAAVTFDFELDENKSDFGFPEGTKSYSKTVLLPCNSVCPDYCLFDLDVFAEAFTQEEYDYLESQYTDIFAIADCVMCGAGFGPEPIIEQFTCKKNIDNEDLYAGDIIEYVGEDWPRLKGLRAVITYDEGLARFRAGFGLAAIGVNAWSECKKVGNIHENPERREGK